MLSHWQNWSNCTNFWPTQHVIPNWDDFRSQKMTFWTKCELSSSQTSWASENREPEMVQLGIHRSSGPLGLAISKRWISQDISRRNMINQMEFSGKNHIGFGGQTHRIGGSKSWDSPLCLMPMLAFSPSLAISPCFSPCFFMLPFWGPNG